MTSTKQRTDITAAMALLAGTAALFTTVPASAQIYRDHGMPAGLDLLEAPDPGVNGERFTVPVDSSPTGPGFDTGNTLFWWIAPSEDVVWNGGSFYVGLQHLALQSADATRRNLFLSATDGSTNFTTAYSPKLGIEHLSLENVNVDPSTIQLAFEGSSFSWAMSNARYDTATRTPLFKVGVPLEMSSVAGTSEIASWSGEIASPTKLVVNPGSTFVFERVGNIGAPEDLTQQLFFSQKDLNTADVNGGTLQLAFSGVVFDAAPDASVVGGEVTGGLVVRNSGTLELLGFDGGVDFARLELRGGMLVDNSTVTLRERSSIELNAPGEDETLVLNNATVNLEADAAFKADFTTFGGTSTVTTAAPVLDLAPAGFRSPVTFQDAATVLNVEGEGDFFAEDLLNLNGGTLNLDMTPNTNRHLVATGPIFGAGTVNVASGNLLEIKGIQSSFDQRTYGTVVVNEGSILVRDGGTFIGGGTIAEAGGVVEVADQGSRLDGDTLSTGGAGLTMGTLTLGLLSELVAGIDPSGGQAGLISVGQLTLDSPVSSLAPRLKIKVYDDIALPLGQKFLLVDYTSISPGSGTTPQFRGMPDGHVFQQGLNTYQIRYSDADYGAANGGNDSVITLTVVESPYETWINGYASIPVDKRGATDDADGDERANVFEFAHNGDPTDPSDEGLLAGLLQDASAPAGDELTLVVAMRNGAVFSLGANGVQSASVDGITSTVEGSVDLVAFPGSLVSHIGGPSSTAPPVTGLPDLTSAGWKYHTFKLNASEGLPSRGFMRTKAAINTAAGGGLGGWLPRI